jgi:hypothetical protein
VYISDPVHIPSIGKPKDCKNERNVLAYAPDVNAFE